MLIHLDAQFTIPNLNCQLLLVYFSGLMERMNEQKTGHA